MDGGPKGGQGEGLARPFLVYRLIILSQSGRSLLPAELSTATSPVCHGPQDIKPKYKGMIELLCNCDTDESGEEPTHVRFTANTNDHSARNGCDTSLLRVKSREDEDEDSMAKLKERLELAETNCSRLEGLYQKYKTSLAGRKLSHKGIRRIAWDAPSPAQSDLQENDSDVREY
ncbi:hypothetical protein C8R48DRAFT_678672 [Suillus tomentosus]|nr:hypothetical protein C8R48DRAFT_678672 [Suillus tomentosus]